MSSNIAVKITADVASLQSQLAIARAEFGATRGSMNELAKQAASSGMNDKLRQDLAQAASNMLAAENRVKGLTAEMKNLTPHTRSAAESIEGLNSVIGKFGVVLGVAEVVEFGKHIFEMAAEVQGAAETLGITTDQLQAFQFAARQSGVALDTAQAALTKFYSGLGLAYEGTGPALRALQDMGLSVGKLAQDQDNASATVARALLAETNQYERNAHIRELFGRGGQDINKMLFELSQGFDKNLEAAKRQGEYLGEDSTKAAHDATIEFAKAKEQLDVALTPAVILLTHELTGLAWMFRDIGHAVPAAGKWLVSFANDAAQAIPVLGPMLAMMEQIAARKKEITGGASGKPFDEAKPYVIPKSGEQVDVAGLNALDSKLRERKILTQEIATATQTLHEAQAAGDSAGVKDARTVIADLQKQLDGLNKTSYGGGFKNAGAELIAQARVTISAINADQTKGDAERRAEIQKTYDDILRSSKLNAAQRLDIEKARNEAITAANKQAAQEKRQIDQANDQAEQQLAKIGFDTRRSQLQEEVAAGRITKQQELAQLIQITDEETQIRLNAIDRAEQGYAHDTAFFIQKELEKKLAVAEAEAQKAAIRRQMEQATAADSVRVHREAARQIGTVENTFVSQMLQGRVGLFGALKAAGMQFAQEEIQQTLKGLTERLLLSKTELAQDQSLGQLGVLSHWLFEGQKTAATSAGESTRVAVKEAAKSAGSAADIASGSAQIMNDAAKSAAGAYSAVVGIPIVGPILAPIAAGTAFAAVAAFDTLTSLDTGTNYLPGDMIVKAHEGERVVPKADNAALIAAVQGSGAGRAGDGKTEFHYHAPSDGRTNHAEDARDMIRIFDHARRTGKLKTR